MRLRVLVVGVAMAALAALTAVRAEATPIGPLTPTATELVATGGDVIIYFAGQSADFNSVLNLIAPAGFLGNPFFPNHATPVGTSLNLGNYLPGTVLRFRLDVSTGNSFFTGPAAGNPDLTLHVAHQIWAADLPGPNAIPVNGILVGFEDILGGGDLDFNDNMFVFTNVLSPEVTPFGTSAPEPISILLIGTGMLPLIRRRMARRS